MEKTEKRTAQSCFERNIHLFDASTLWKGGVLFLHALNQSAGLRCDGLLENDPATPGIRLRMTRGRVDFDAKLPDWWATSEVISLRYAKLSGKHIYFKYLIAHDSIEVNAVAEERNDQILSLTIKYIERKENGYSMKEFAGVDWNNVEVTAVDVKKKYTAEILDRLIPPASGLREFAPEPEPVFPQHPFPLPGFNPGVVPPYLLSFIYGCVDPEESTRTTRSQVSTRILSLPIGNVENYVGPHSGIFARRPGSMYPRYEPPGMYSFCFTLTNRGGEPDPDIFPQFPSQNPPGGFGPHFPPPRGGGGFFPF